MPEICTNTREVESANPDGTGTEIVTVKTCGFDLTEARLVRGDDLIRCPQCGRKLGTTEVVPPEDAAEDLAEAEASG